MKRILVVDDDAMNCVIAKHALGTNYEVETVNSGQEALDFLEKENVDLILMDKEMPEMSGIEVVGKIKEREEWNEIPIIFLTADKDPQTEVECLSCGADDFIIKPFVPLVVNTRVKNTLEIYELRKDLERKLEKSTQQMEKARMKSLTDALTGLHNREYLQKTLRSLLEKGETGTLFMIDLDNFKTINDTYGHIVGDKTLQHFASVLKQHARESDIVCRLAGDEFVVFYPSLTDRIEAGKKAEGIIRTFAEKMGALGYGGIVSVSIGIMITEGGYDFQELYNKADTSLYFVKNNGKNAYHFYDDMNEQIEEINTVADMDSVSRMMEEGLTDKRGIFQLAYDEFKSVYDYVSRCVARKKQKVQVVLFTMNMWDKNVETSLEEIMYAWEESLTGSLRAVDAGTRYSSSQYMIILMDVDMENGREVSEKVIKAFYDNNESFKNIVKVSYDIRTMPDNTIKV